MPTVQPTRQRTTDPTQAPPPTDAPTAAKDTPTGGVPPTAQPTRQTPPPTSAPTARPTARPTRTAAPTATDAQAVYAAAKYDRCLLACEDFVVEANDKHPTCVRACMAAQGVKEDAGGQPPEPKADLQAASAYAECVGRCDQWRVEANDKHPRCMAACMAGGKAHDASSGDGLGSTHDAGDEATSTKTKDVTWIVVGAGVGVFAIAVLGAVRCRPGWKQPRAPESWKGDDDLPTAIPEADFQQANPMARPPVVTRELSER